MRPTLQEGQMVTRCPTVRHYNLPRNLVPTYGICLKLVYLAYETGDCKWRVLWSSEGGSWDEIVREKDLMACKEDADQL